MPAVTVVTLPQFNVNLTFFYHPSNLSCTFNLARVTTESCIFSHSSIWKKFAYIRVASYVLCDTIEILMTISKCVARFCTICTMQKPWKTYGIVLLLVKWPSSMSVFHVFHVFWYKWYQIAQSITIKVKVASRQWIESSIEMKHGQEMREYQSCV